MPSARDLSDSAAGYLVAVPQVAAGVCQLCHGASNPGYGLCFSCDQTCGQVDHPVRQVFPISLSQTGEQLHHVLRGYQDNPDPAVRARFSLIVAALLTRFLVRHGSCVAAAAGGRWEMATTVPSRGKRPPPHPLDVAIGLSPWLSAQGRPRLARGAADIGHNRASDGAYLVTEEVAGRRLLLLDDTFTTGASLPSAASALATAGAQVVAAVVVGRFMRPDFSAAAELWSRARASAFDFERCCVCPQG